MGKEYKKRRYLSYQELRFYKILKELENEGYIVIPQVNLATIVEKKDNKKWHNELFKNIDFAIFSEDYKKILLLIELNDKTHENEERKKRDRRIWYICRDANIDLMIFLTKYPNNREYVLKKIKTKLEKGRDYVS